ncbi:hypothetical protein E0500_002415 [Streptomyces sp. KM273126]|uniref:hypothetical protein n=1 Tax=Streptomyces sp. KM273126 TaxID=2545247 RepID=UPI00103CAFD6|nr:hypothetical protein [Streptomyces sp. KM273126]MBA2806343.1 hypothetical protein [Streptomyces sp. KM273126]
MNTSLRRSLAATTATLALGLGIAVSGPVPAAHATAAECERGANGFVDISDDLGGREARAVDLGGGVWVTLEYGQVSGAQRGWAKIRGSGTRNGDLVWMDWTTTGGNGWLQCGPFSVDRGAGTSKTSAAKTTSSSPAYQFRACGKRLSVGQSKCTSWW